MKTKIKLLLLTAGLFLSLASYSQTLSPTVISSSGGFFSSASASLSFTVAEMTMVQTFTTSGNILTQGFQQPEDYSVGISESDITANDFIIYPNPTSGAFTIEFNTANGNTATVRLFNPLGQLVLTSNYAVLQGINKVSFDISSFSQGIYLLELSNGKSNEVPVLKKINLLY